MTTDIVSTHISHYTTCAKWLRQHTRASPSPNPGKQRPLVTLDSDGPDNVGLSNSYLFVAQILSIMGA